MMLMHFRGNMDFWDPALINRLALCRPILPLDNAGIGEERKRNTNNTKRLGQPCHCSARRTANKQGRSAGLFDGRRSGSACRTGRTTQASEANPGGDSNKPSTSYSRSQARCFSNQTHQTPPIHLSISIQ